MLQESIGTIGRTQESGVRDQLQKESALRSQFPTASRCSPFADGRRLVETMSLKTVAGVALIIVGAVMVGVGFLMAGRKLGRKSGRDSTVD